MDTPTRRRIHTTITIWDHGGDHLEVTMGLWLNLNGVALSRPVWRDRVEIPLPTSSSPSEWLAAVLAALTTL